MYVRKLNFSFVKLRLILATFDHIQNEQHFLGLAHTGDSLKNIFTQSIFFCCRVLQKSIRIPEYSTLFFKNLWKNLPFIILCALTFKKFVDWIYGILCKKSNLKNDLYKNNYTIIFNIFELWFLLLLSIVFFQVFD